MDNTINSIGFTSKHELFPGVWVYKNVIKPEHRFVERVDEIIQSSNGKHIWQEALVGYSEKRPEYRDCQDFKLSKNEYASSLDDLELNTIWQEAHDAQNIAVEDYSAMYSLRLEYWEAMNFIQYGPGQHFQEHADHGFSYVATVSLVAYPNDGYEGGELYFPKLNLNIKPEAGDLYIFPSTYLFSHVAKPVTSGRKFSIVTMLDYNDECHNEDFMRLRGQRLQRARNKSL